METPHKMVDGEKVYLTEQEIAFIEAERLAWEAGTTKRNALAEIQRLENLETPRRLAEALLSEQGKAWLANNRQNIEQQRLLINN